MSLMSSMLGSLATSGCITVVMVLVPARDLVEGIKTLDIFRLSVRVMRAFKVVIEPVVIARPSRYSSLPLASDASRNASESCH